MFSAEFCSAFNAGEVNSEAAEAMATAAAADFRAWTLALARAVADGIFAPDNLAKALTLAKVDPSEASAVCFADSVWFAWLESEGSAAVEERKGRLADLGREALKASLVSKRLLMEIGEGDFMEECGLVVNYREGWRKKEIRANTRHVYTQRKFNLAREESEGYSKLVTLLNQSGAGSIKAAAAEAALDELKALIGFFDLDPNHACSLVLDAFGAQPHNDAYLELLPAFSTDAVEQLLGFHFSKEGNVPRGMYHAAAKVIKVGIVPLECLLAHLRSSAEQVKAAWEAGMAGLEQAVARIGVISLTKGNDSGGGTDPVQAPAKRVGQTAAALELDPRPFALHVVGEDGGVSSQHSQLLAALLECGAWDHAMALTNWLGTQGVKEVAMFPAVARALCQLLAVEIAPLYRHLYPQSVLAGMLEKQTAEGANGGVATLQLSRRALDVLRLLGHHLYHDVATLTRLTRITASAVLGAGKEAAVDVLSAYIMPAAMMIPSNSALVLEVWNVLKQLPYTERFCLYFDLKEATSRSLLLTASAKLAETEVRRVLRRVTAPANKREAKLTVRPLSRMLAKIANANPLAVSQQLLRQVMGMPGMVISITEALKFMAPPAFDVTTYAIIAQLASGKKKLKEDGINLEEWFQWLAAFTGMLCRKNEYVEVTALVQYVVNQLKCCESLDLLVLKEMVSTMAGVDPVFDISDTQLDALAGSETLIRQVVAQTDAWRRDRAAQRGMQRLLAALRVGPPAQQLAIPLLILLAQQRKLITLQPQSFHLKLVAELYDKCHEVTMQYIEFLHKALPAEEYASLLPSISELATEYRIDPEIIFELYRPIIRGVLPPAAPVDDFAEPEAGEVAQVGNAPAQVHHPVGDDKAKPAAGGDDDEEGEIAGAPTEPGGAQAMDVEDGEVAGAGGAAVVENSHVVPEEYGGPIWEELAAHTASLVPEGGFKGLTQTLFVTFWSLSLYDLDVPVDRYESTLAQVRSAARMARDDLEAARRDTQRGLNRYGHGGHGGGFGMQPPPPPPPPQQVELDVMTRELERLEATAAQLPMDLKEQQANAAAVEARLRETRGAWIIEDTAESQAAAAKEFVQFCILPRVLNSPGDALYCARFLRKAHALGPPGFRLLSLMDRLFKELGFLVRCSTAREAGNIGIFFGELMAMVTRWRGAKEYAQECSASEAFRSYKAGELHAVSYPEFVKLSANWHRKLTLDVFKTCLASGDYMQMKNALLVLNRMVRIYPATREDAQELLRTLGPLRDADPREDLKILARMYCTALEMALRDKNRAVVDSRQEYAGLPPPPKKKVKPAPKPQTAAPGKEAERGAAEGPTGDGKREGGGPGPGDGAAALVLVLGKKADRPVSTRQRDRAEDRQRQRGSEREQRPTRADREKRDELERRGRAGRDTKGAEGPSSGDAGQGGGKGDARRGSAGEELDRSERPSNRSNLDTERRPLSDRGRGRERDERRGNLRVEASEFVPGSSKDSGRERRFDDTPAADGERDAKRPRRSIRDESRQGDRQDRNRERDQLRQPATKGDTNDAQGQNATSRPERSFETDQPEEPSHASGVVEEDRGRQRERGRNRDRERELPQRSDTRDEKAQDDRKGGSGSGRPAGETDAERLQDGARGNISRTPTEREASGSQVEAPPPQQAEVLGALPPKEQEGIASPGDAQPEKAGRKHARDEEERENRHKRHKRDRKEKDRKRDRKDRSKSKDRDQDREATKPREVPEDDIRPPARLLGRLGTGSGAALGAGVKDRGNGGGGDSRGSGRRERRGDRSRR